ncbi:MAG: BON domain-containing protein [Methylococcales bacterium]
MRRFLWLVLIHSFLLGGCATPPSQNEIQQAAKYDRRSLDAIASDKDIEQSAIEELYSDKDLTAQSYITVNAYNGTVLMTGEVANEALKNKALDIVRVIRHVKMVRDNLTIASPSDSVSRDDDSQLNQRVKTALTQIYTLPDFNSAMIKVVTENSVVYLMGRVSREEGKVVVNVTRLQAGVKQIVTVFEYLD